MRARRIRCRRYAHTNGRDDLPTAADISNAHATEDVSDAHAAEYVSNAHAADGVRTAGLNSMPSNSSASCHVHPLSGAAAHIA